MHPRLIEITGVMADVRAELAAFLQQCTVQQLHRDAGTGRWTVAQIVDHCGRTEGSIAKMLEGQFAKAMAEGLPEDPDTSSLLHSLDKWDVKARSTRLEAPERVRPAERPDFDAAWTSLQAVRQRTLAAVATVDGRDLTRVSAPHPFFGPLNGYEWLLLLGLHEARHLEQMREVLGGS